MVQRPEGEIRGDVQIEGKEIQEAVQFADPKLEGVIRVALGSWRGNFGGPILKSKLRELTALNARLEQITNLSGVAHCTELQELNLKKNQISDISPIVNNPSIGEGDEVDLRDNPLDDEAYNKHIPALQERGVEVLFDPKP